ncbi:unnamed protein product [Diamesa tonsa]
MTTFMLNFVLISVYGQIPKGPTTAKTTTTTIPTTIADKIELPPSSLMKPTNKANYQGLPGPPPYPPMQLPPRSSLLDSIFNIPIQALKAVNELVQGIAGNINMMQSSYSQGRPEFDRYSRSSRVNDDGESCKPLCFNFQLITFKDGKLGVNFAGFTADVGLGGLLTGNAAHGGLSASAGTPFGQKAGAGIGGTVNGPNGRTAGGAYAGASAGYGTGASTAIGGAVDEFGQSGGHGSEAHTNGLSTKTVQLSQYPQGPQNQQFDTRFGGQDAPAYTKREYRKKYRQQQRNGNNNGVEVESRIDVQPAQSRQPQENFDYRNFFDFGFFSNLGSSFSGDHQENPDYQTINIQKQLTPNTILLNRSVVPKIPKRVEVPKAKVEDDSFEDEIEDEVKIEERVRSVEKTSAEELPLPQADGIVKSKTVIKSRHNIQHNPNFFNDIFNV